MKEFEWFTTVVDNEDYEILKRGFHRAIKKYPKEEVLRGLVEHEFWKRYAGLSEKQSEQINKILTKAIFSGKWTNKDYIVRAIMAVGVTKQQAEMIAITELANLANRVREIAYKDYTKVRKFVWVTEKDDRVCEKCKEVERRTQGGVTIEELKAIIKEIGGDTAREYVLHPQCRCAFKRNYVKGRIRMRWWE